MGCKNTCLLISGALLSQCVSQCVPLSYGREEREPKYNEYTPYAGWTLSSYRLRSSGKDFGFGVDIIYIYFHCQL